MKVLITGAAGFIGSHLAERLHADGHDVTGLDCVTDYYAVAQKEENIRVLETQGIPIRRIDLAGELSGQDLAQFEAIYHLAAQPGNSPATKFDDYLRNNIVATENLTASVPGSAKLRIFVQVSTSSVYGSVAKGDETSVPQPTSPYGVTKLAAEQLVLSKARTKGFPACSARLFSVYGPRERPDKLYPKLILSALEGHPLPLFEGSEKHFRSFTYVADAVNGLASILNRIDPCLSEIFNIGSDTRIAVGEAIAIVEEITGRKANFQPAGQRAGDQLDTCADIRKARRVLGYEPKVQPREGISRQIEWFRERLRGA